MPKTESEEQGQKKNEASKSRKEAGAPKRVGAFPIQTREWVNLTKEDILISRDLMRDIRRS
jgi:hypothetical protein